MQRIIACRSIRVRSWCMAAAILVAVVPALSQESKSSWMLIREQSGANEVSAQSEITAPQGAGFATLRIRCQAGVNPPVIVSFIVESLKRLPMFPFEIYDGPVDVTENEFMKLELAPGDQGRARTMKLIPNGYRAITPEGAFVFETTEKRVVSFLLEI